MNYLESALTLFISFIINLGIISLFGFYYNQDIDDFKTASE